MNKKIVFSAALVLTLAIGISIPIIKNVYASESASSYDQVGDLVNDNGFKYLKMDFKKTNQTVNISKESAIDTAKQLSGGLDSSSVKINASEVVFTDEVVKNKIPGSNIVPKDLVVWLVTFKGLSLNPPSSGPITKSNKLKPFTEMNVIIDANTGKMVEEFSFR